MRSDDTISWTAQPTSARFRISPQLLRDHWIEEWAADDPEAIRTADGLEFSVRYERWIELGTPPPEDADPELVDLFRSQHSSLSRLLGRASQRIFIEPVGHVGAPDLSFLVSVDGTAVGDATELVPFARDGTGEVYPLVPAAFVAYQRVCRWNAKRSTTRAEQIVFVGELRDHLDRSASALASAAVPFSFELAPHLQAFRTEHAGRVALGWKPRKNGALFDLELEQIRADGTRAQIDLRKLDPDNPLISISPTEHVLLDPEVEAVARVAKKQVNKLRKHAEPHLANPATLLPEGLSLDSVDLSSYSPRVVGFSSIVKAERFIDIKSSGTEWYQKDSSDSVPFLRLDIAQPGGEMETLTFATPEAAAEAVVALERELEKGAPEAVNIGDRRVMPTRPLADRIKQDLSQFRPHGAAGAAGSPDAQLIPDKPRGRLAAVIAEEIEPDEATREVPGAHLVPWDILEKLLAVGYQLKSHQRAGIEWMWSNYQRHEPGVLLADDMGLGKTLQIASFLALQRATEPSGSSAPSMIVCPVILLENWRAELRKFFQPNVFGSLLVLHGDAVKKRKRGTTLDVSDLQRVQYVLTNYETLQAHQQSLLTLDWSVVVLDEAHAIKNPDTYRARAARGMKRRFGIASTGTPVENRLSDLWGLYDFLSPGRPFSTIKSFEEKYETDLAQGIAMVREDLRYPGAASTLLRRTKNEVLDLPDKTVVVHRIPMTPDQAERERSITAYGEQHGGILRILQDLQKLYQHPRLLLPEAEREPIPSATALRESPKLALCLRVLREIRNAGEKALVFTLWTAMQELLAKVIQEELGLKRVSIINGEPARRSAAIQRIDEFSQVEGFSVMVLSPLAAGTGLTITAANHVIHYGRWWNPAKEDQATDRAYRIGQTRPVRVHYPLLTHPDNASLGFDVKLHELVEGKRGMARDFLAPQSHDVTAHEIAELQGRQARA